VRHKSETGIAADEAVDANSFRKRHTDATFVYFSLDSALPRRRVGDVRLISRLETAVHIWEAGKSAPVLECFNADCPSVIPGKLFISGYHLGEAAESLMFVAIGCLLSLWFSIAGFTGPSDGPSDAKQSGFLVMNSVDSVSRDLLIQNLLHCDASLRPFICFVCKE
jgi:hypothetical protein